MVKRAIDIVLSFVALVVLSPLVGLIAIGVKLDSTGPVLYSQTRVGRRGRPFRIHKFRTMVDLADRIGPQLTGSNDDRITRFGRWLRRLRVDEIPQLLNVLKGDMSLVGPRPEVPSIVARYSDAQRAVLDVRPGITGPTQLTWLDEAEQYPRDVDRTEYYVRHILPPKLESDLTYVATRSLTGDVGYMLRTPLVLLRSARPRLSALWPKLVRLAVDAAAVGLAHVLSFESRFEWRVPETAAPYLVWGLPLTCAVYVLAFVLLRTYRGMWRFTSLGDLWRLAKGILLGASLQAVALVLLGWRPYPRSIVVSTAVLAMMFLGGLRVIRRVQMESASAGPAMPRRSRVAIIGAGRTGDSIAREICETASQEYELVGFFDDDPAKRGATIRDCPVLGTVEELAALAPRYRIEEAIIAIPGLAGRPLRRIVDLCGAAGVAFKSVPSLAQLVRGEGKLRYLRKVNLDGLLPREPVHTDEARIRALLQGKRVMVTGAGGSIGSELCRQVLRLGAESLIMVERAENALHDISLDIRNQFPGSSVTAALADVKHVPRMVEIFRRCRPEIVFHAAAYKHVPILEDHPGEAVLNNIVGTKRLVDVALRFGVDAFVFISTDKAVSPRNLMGVTKRICEMYITALNRKIRKDGADGRQPRFVMVRFGNVLGSAGSVLPIFQRQIENGDPMTITDPDVTRFFMTIPEAVGLVLQSVSMDCPGDVFVLDMGQPVKIGALADGLVASLGLSPYDVDRQYVGLRPGEKLAETLWEPDEEVSGSDHPKIFVARQHARSLEEMQTHLAALENLAVEGNVVGLLRHLAEMVPQYKPDYARLHFAVSEPGEVHRVLVVDDDDSMCSVIHDVLSEHYVVSTASSIRQGLARVRADHPHLILLDLALLDGSGLELCRTHRRDPIYQAIPIIFMTGYGDSRTVVTALEAGGDDYLAKPFELEELRARVDAVVRRSAGMTGVRAGGTEAPPLTISNSEVNR
jgi:FlaA1/EpsC-like NDP-sugar epimerase/lipopolysaccharide/colanic/teichoic acid biosynthesis glycosyltransferase/ActR/RegA family two-component response regulator